MQNKSPMYWRVAIGLLLSLTACHSNETIKTNFSLEGTIQGAAGDSIYVEIVAAYQSLTDTFLIASTRIDEKGYFSLKGTIRGLGRYQIRLGKQKPQIIPITPVPGDNIKVMAYRETFETNPGLQGAAWTKTANQYFQYIATLDQTNGSEKLMVFIAKEIRSNPSNPFHIVLTEHLTPPSEEGKLQTWNANHLNLLNMVSASFNTTYGAVPATKGLRYKDSLSHEIYNGFQQKNSRKDAIKQESLLAPDFILMSITGEKFRLSEHRGKAILLYFWGLEFPNGAKDNQTISALQKQQNALEVVSISCDKNIEDWKKALRDYSFSGKWQLTDANGSSNPGAINGRSVLLQQYAIGELPHAVLINSQGYIVAEGMTGEDLKQYVKRYLN